MQPQQNLRRKAVLCHLSAHLGSGIDKPARNRPCSFHHQTGQTRGRCIVRVMPKIAGDRRSLQERNILADMDADMMIETQTLTTVGPAFSVTNLNCCQPTPPSQCLAAFPSKSNQYVTMMILTATKCNTPFYNHQVHARQQRQTLQLLLICASQRQQWPHATMQSTANICTFPCDVSFHTHGDHCRRNISRAYACAS